MKILFAAFSSHNDNEASAALDLVSTARSFSDGMNSVCTLELPYTWDKSYQVLEQALQDHWNAVIIVDSSEELESVAIERIALNDYNVSVKDANGRRPLSKHILDGGDSGYWTGLPFRSLVNELSTDGVECHASHSSGAGIANYVFYRMMHWIASENSNVKGGLIRVPELNGRLSLNSEGKKKTIAKILEVLTNPDLENEDMLSFDPKQVKLFKGSPAP